MSDADSWEEPLLPKDRVRAMWYIRKFCTCKKCDSFRKSADKILRWSHDDKQWFLTGVK